MEEEFWFNWLPLWGVFPLAFAMVIGSIFTGTIWGMRIKRKVGHEAQSALGTITGSTLGLLAFLLAFTYGIAVNIGQTRKALFLDEVNIISTVYLQSQLLTEPHRREILELIGDYVNARVELANVQTKDYMQRLPERIAYSDALQDKIWEKAIALIRSNDNPPLNAVFIQSLNTMFDLQTSRIALFRYRIAPIIWYALFFITILSTGSVGYHVGFSGRSSLKMGIVLALTFATVMLLIADLDRPTSGSLQVDRQPIFELQKKIQSQMPSMVSDKLE